MKTAFDRLRDYLANTPREEVLAAWEEAITHANKPDLFEDSEQSHRRFSNTPNEMVTLPDGRKIWIARNCANVGVVIAIRQGIPHILMGKRGPGCPDEIGKWVLPSGYLDWDESLVEGCEREIFEETGFDIRPVVDSAYHNDFVRDMPCFIRHHPSTLRRKQTVTHYWGLVFPIDELPALTNEHCEPGEVDELKWMTFDEIATHDIGFNHHMTIEKFMKLFWREEWITWSLNSTGAQQGFAKLSSNIRKQIFTIMGQQEMTQSDLARAMKINTSQVSNMLKPNHNFTVSTLEKISHVLGINISIQLVG